VIVEQARHEWPHTWLFAGILTLALYVLIFFLYQPTFQYLMGLWNKLDAGEYGHGYLVIAISLFLVVRSRRRLAFLIPCPSYMAIPAVVASSLLWLFALLADVSVIQSVALLLLVLSVSWTLLGNQVIRILAFPILFIGFALPIWFLLSPLLQDIAADVVFWVIRLLKVPAFRQEHTIMLPAGSLSIAEACSGLRYMLAGLTLGTLYAYLNYEDNRARLIVVLISAVAAVLANIVRVFIVVYLGYSTEMQHPFVQDHLMLGWYLFGGIVFVLLLVDARLIKHYRQACSVDEVKHNISENNHPGTMVCNKGSLQYAIVMLTTVLIVSVGPASAYVVKNQTKQEHLDVGIDLPKSIGGWKIQDGANDDWMPVYHGAITHKSAYQRNGEQLTIFIGYYPGQRQGEELINRLNRISNEDVWHIRYSRAHTIQVEDQSVLEQLLEKSNGKKRLVWYWYNVAGHRTTNKYEAKVLQILGFLTGKQQSFLVAVAADLNDSPESVRRLLRDFVIKAESSLYRTVEKKT